MSARKRFLLVVVAGATLFSLSGCFLSAPEAKPAAASCPASKEGNGLRVAMMLPLTGDEQALGTSISAGVRTAIEDINTAGGVLGEDVSISTVADSGDSDHLQVASSNALTIVRSGAAAVVGPLGSSSSLTAEPALSRGCVVQYSMGYREGAVPTKGYLFPVSPSDAASGSVLAQRLVDDGRQRVAFVTVDDPTATAVLDKTIDALGDRATVVYGDSSNEAGLEPTQIPAAIQAVAGASPDAVVVLGPGAEGDILAALGDAGVRAARYLVDNDVVDYANQISASALADTTGIVSGRPGSSDLVQRLGAAAPSVEQIELATKSYDLTVATALAAQAAKGITGADVRTGLPLVWADNGTSCSTFAQCASLLKSGKPITYASQSSLALQDGTQQIEASEYTVDEYTSDGSVTESGTLSASPSGKQ